MAASMLMLRWIRIYSLDQIVPKSERRRIVDGSKSGFRLHRFNRPMGINYPSTGRTEFAITCSVEGNWAFPRMM